MKLGQILTVIGAGVTAYGFRCIHPGAGWIVAGCFVAVAGAIQYRNAMKSKGSDG